MIEEIKQLKSKALEQIDQVKNGADLDKVWRQYLGRQNGELTKVLRGLKDLPANEKPKVGTLANQVKQEIDQAIDNKNENYPVLVPKPKVRLWILLYLERK